MAITVKEAKEKINEILDDVICSKDEYDNVVKPIEDITCSREKTVEELKKLYPVGDCIVPDNIEELPKLSLPNHKFVAPRTIDLRDYCTPTSNQGRLPHCAGHAAAAYAENILWRKNDYYEDIDPDMLYYYAKTIDGSGENEKENGTTLTAVLQALIDKGYFDKDKCGIRVIWKDDDFINKISYALHKYGCLLLALNISEEFYHVSSSKTSITGNSYTNKVGGHALLCCGKTPDGIIILNSWGDWGQFGFALVTWKALKEQFLYGALLDNCLYETHMN